jgi:tetratricopeptide (TPR) repeat protein
MESYERWLGAGPELAVLHLIGLFDRPAEGGALDALRAAPVISELTDALSDEEEPLSDRDWDRAVTKLRHARLLLDRDSSSPDALDAHPLVREHFGQKVKESNPAAWKEAHSRLYEYYKSHAKEYPDTLEEMMPLYMAVVHGCQAGRHREAMHEVYVRRINRGEEFFSTNKLGAFGADLASLSGFFDLSWRQPVAGLTEADKAFILNQAGFRLRALGRLAEAAQLVKAALAAAKEQEDWRNAVRYAINLGQLYLATGDLTRALGYARQGVELADTGGNAVERIGARTALAEALHQVGRLKDAKAAFCEAEEMRKARQSEYPLLYGFASFLYCDLLLDQRNYREVQGRTAQMLEWLKQGREANLLDIALDHLSLGRAYLLQAQDVGTGDLSQVADELDQAVEGLRQAGHQECIVLGLLARAELHREMRDFDRARRDLDETMTIATRGNMKLHEADCHLGYARLYLAEGKNDKVRESLDKAKGMIGDMGYHRRDKEVEALEKQLENIKK